MTKRTFAFLIVLAAGFAAYFYISPAKAPEMLVTNPIAKRLAGVPMTLDVFFTLENKGGPDALISVRSDAADMATIIRPAAVSVTPIPAATSPVFSDDGVFVRLSGTMSDTVSDLQDGTLVPLVLHFEKAGDMAIKARVTASDGMGGMAMDHSAHGTDEPAATLSMTVAEQPGGKGWTLELATENFEFVKPDEKMMDMPGQGHAHLYLNGLKLTRLYSPAGTIGALLPGTYTVRVELYSNMHARIMAHDKPVVAMAEIVAK